VYSRFVRVQSNGSKIPNASERRIQEHDTLSKLEPFTSRKNIDFDSRQRPAPDDFEVKPWRMERNSLTKRENNIKKKRLKRFARSRTPTPPDQKKDHRNSRTIGESLKTPRWWRARRVTNMRWGYHWATSSRKWEGGQENLVTSFGDEDRQENWRADFSELKAGLTLKRTGVRRN